MRKLIIVLLVVLAFGEIEGLKPLLGEVLPAITHKEKVKVFTLAKYYVYFRNKKFMVVMDCKESDIVFGNFICDDKPTFALSYDFYKKHKNVIGVFYYRKGRPQLKFKKEGLIKFFKTISKSLRNYVQ